jgi:hypothetical protein
MPSARQCVNALTRAETRPLQPAQTTPRQSVAKAVLKAESDALAPLGAYADLRRSYDLTEQRWESCNRKLDEYGIPAEQRESQQRELAEIDLSRGAEERDIRELAQALVGALRAGPSWPVNRILAGLLLDAFPQAQGGQPETFIEVLVSDITELGHAPIVVAHALRELRRTVKFRPTIAEVCEACSATKETIWRMLSSLEFRADNLRRRAEGAAKFTDAQMGRSGAHDARARGTA